MPQKRVDTSQRSLLLLKKTPHKCEGVDKFRLIPFRSPLLRDSRLISFPLGTKMFQFSRCPPHNLCIQLWVIRHYSYWVFPFGYPRIKACLAAPRGFSQPTTSFIGIARQGIHHMPVTTFYLLSITLTTCK